MVVYDLPKMFENLTLSFAETGIPQQNILTHLLCHLLSAVNKLWEKIVAEAMSSCIRKQYGCMSRRRRGGGGSKISPDFPVSVSLAKCTESKQKDLKIRRYFT